MGGEVFINVNLCAIVFVVILKLGPFCDHPSSVLAGHEAHNHRTWVFILGTARLRKPVADVNVLLLQLGVKLQDIVGQGYHCCRRILARLTDAGNPEAAAAPVLLKGVVLEPQSSNFTLEFSSVQFSSLLEAGPGYGPLFPDLRITFLRRVLRTIRFCNGQMDI